MAYLVPGFERGPVSLRSALTAHSSALASRAELPFLRRYIWEILEPQLVPTVRWTG